MFQPPTCFGHPVYVSVSGSEKLVGWGSCLIEVVQVQFRGSTILNQFSGIYKHTHTHTHPSGRNCFSSSVELQLVCIAL